jgi:hypothetical protein
MLDGVWRFLRQGDLRTDGHNVMVYRGDVPNLEFEVGVEVSRTFDAAGAIVPSRLPEGRAAHPRTSAITRSLAMRMTRSSNGAARRAAP